MRSSLGFMLALIVIPGLCSDAWAQRGRSAPRPMRVEPVSPNRGPGGGYYVPVGGHHGSNRSSSSDGAGWLCPLFLIGGLIVAVIVVVSGQKKAGNNPPARAVPHHGVALKSFEKSTARPIQIRIIAVPPGEAPERIRAAWVGLELPLASGEVGVRDQPTFGVISKSSLGFLNGYGVDGREAVQRLAVKNPDVAGWWRAHAPHVLERGYRFIFPAENCELVKGRVGNDLVAADGFMPAPSTDVFRR